MAPLGVVWPPFSPVREPRLEWKVGLFSLELDAPFRVKEESHYCGPLILDMTSEFLNGHFSQ